MALQGQTIDVPLSTVDQNTPTTTRPVGKLSSLVDCLVTKWYHAAPGLNSPGSTSVEVQPRPGFVQQTLEIRDPANSVSVGGATLVNAGALTTVGDQLVAVVGGRPMMLAPSISAWDQPQDILTPTQTLKSEVVYTSSAQAWIPDTGRLSHNGSGISLVAWFEVGVGVKAMVRDDAGNVLRAPFLVSATDTRVKCVSDGSRFYLVSDDGATMTVRVIDSNGVSQASNTIVSNTSYWDLTFALGQGVLIALPILGGGAGVRTTTVTLTGGPAVTLLSTTDTTINADGGSCGWIVNNSGDNKAYLATLSVNAGGSFEVRGYRIATRVQDFAITAHTAFGNIVNITGYVVENAAPSMVLTYTSQDTSLTYTPLLNSTYIRNVPSGGGATTLRLVKSLSLATRALALDGQYYAGTYLQSTTQPCWFLMPLAVSVRNVSGRWDYGVAYADWQNNTGSNKLFSLASAPKTAAGGYEIPLSYRAESFTSAVKTGKDVIISINTPVNAVGIKMWSIGVATSRPAVSNGQLLVPGLQTNTVVAGMWSEQGINTAPEPPTHTLAAGSLTGNYQWVFVYEYTDNNGNRVRSIPSTPVSNSGAEAAGVHAYVFSGFSLNATTLLNLSVSVYRTINVGGVQSIAHYKVSNDLAPVVNDPTATTWNFTDNMSDTNAALGEQLYTDQGFLSRYPMPPGSVTTDFNGRTVTVAPDNSLWISGPKQEGDALWFHPALRVIMPTSEAVKSLASLDDYLLIYCSNSIWAAPRTVLPDATGQNGTLPTPFQLPFPMGSLGPAVVVREGCVYASSAGGLWLISRDLQNKWVGEDATDDLAAAPITALAVDSSQRIYAAVGTSIVVLDTLVEGFYRWTVPATASAPKFLATWKGQLAFIDAGSVWLSTPGHVGTDQDASGTLIYTPIITIAPMHMLGIRNYKRCWTIQLQGKYRGPHTLNVQLTYDDDATVVQTKTIVVTDPTKPYVFEIQPQQELFSSVGMVIFPTAAPASFLGDSFSLEMVSFYVGVEPKGLNRIPINRRM